MDELLIVYADKLRATGSHNDSLKKVAWVAYKKGLADAVIKKDKQ